jgi:hypothetical protein
MCYMLVVALLRSPRGRRTATVLLGLALAVSLVPPARGQSSLGTIRGRVSDARGVPVPSASIRVVDESTGVTRATDADAHGNYEVPNLRAGTYRVEDNSPGIIAFRTSGVVLRAGETARADLVLVAATQEIAAVTEEAPEPSAGAPRLPVRPDAVEIVVSGESHANIQPETPAIQGGLDARLLQDLPRGTRDFQDFLYLNPNMLAHPDGFQVQSGRSYGFSYLQDGQPSNGALFGRLTLAAPALDAIDEVKVFANSYSAEAGGLGAVMVTSRRGGSLYSGSAFYDFNADELNALTYDQKEAGLKRGFPGSDTEAHRYGLTLGGPIRREKTFFFAAYEGSRATEVGGGRLTSVPSLRMREGDFSQASFTIIDPWTGQPFPGNVIPRDRIDPAATRILRFFYPLPNLPDQPNGLGRYQEFVNLPTTRNRADLRLDHELSQNDSVFLRGSWQARDPRTFFENASLPNLGTQDRRFRALTAAGSWVHVASSRLMNELRAGFNQEVQNRRSHFVVGQVADDLQIEVPSGSRERRGHTSFTFSGSNRIASLGGESFDTNANRDIHQSTLSVSDTLTWFWGRHSLRLGASFSRDHVKDGFSLGANGAAGIFAFNGAATRNSLSDLLLGLPATSTEGINTRGLNPLDASSNVIAVFAQDDLRVGSRLTLFFGLRYEVITPFKEAKNLLVNFDTATGQLVVPGSETIPYLTQDATVLPRAQAEDFGLGPGLVKTDMDNLAPRVGFAYRPGGNSKTVIRGGAGRFFPTSAAQGIRDALSRAPFRARTRRLFPSLASGFSTGVPSTSTGANANTVAFDLESPEFYQYNLTLERELGGLGLRLSYLGTQERKVLINRNLNTLPASTVSFDPADPEDRQRLPYPNLSTEVNAVLNEGRGHTNALQVELRRSFRSGFGFDMSYTLSESRTNAPDFGNSSLGIVQYDPYDLSKSEGPHPMLPRHRFVLNALWDIPVGRGRRFLSGMPVWADVLLGGWTVGGIAFARSGYHLTPLYWGVDDGGVNPANTGFPLLNNAFDEAWRPDLVGDPKGPRNRDNFYNLAAFQLPAPGTTGTAGNGVIEGPGTWVVNLGFYKDIFRYRGVRLQVRVTLDNAFNHPQFYIDPLPDPSEPGFLNLTDYMVGGLSPTESNGTTNVLNDVRSAEGFAAGRVVRVGVRLTF